MSISESFVTYIKANSAITNLLATADSVYPGSLPQHNNGVPALTHRLDSDDDIQQLDGGVNELSFATIRLTVWAYRVKEVHDIATTLKSELRGYRGALGTHTAEHVLNEIEYSLPEELETNLNGLVLGFRIAYY